MGPGLPASAGRADLVLSRCPRSQSALLKGQSHLGGGPSNPTLESHSDLWIFLPTVPLPSAFPAPGWKFGGWGLAVSFPVSRVPAQPSAPTSRLSSPHPDQPAPSSTAFCTDSPRTARARHSSA